jgi:iron complex transport system substrate-binding protein
MIRIVLLFLAALGAAAALSACGQRAEPTGEVPPSYPVTAQGAAEAPLVLDRAPERIVVLDRGPAELIDALGAGGRIVGAPAGVILADGTDPTDVVSANGQVDVDAVADLDPDLIVATPEVDSVGRERAREEAGAPLYLQPARTADDVVRATFELGALVGEPVAARTLAASLREDLAALEARLADAEPSTVFVDTGLFVTLSSNTIFGDLLARARGSNVAPDPSSGPITAEALAAADPDVYLVTSDSRLTLEELRRREETRDLTAVKEGRFQVIPLELVTTAGPDIAMAIQELAVALHPDAFR